MRDSYIYYNKSISLIRVGDKYVKIPKYAGTGTTELTWTRISTSWEEKTTPLWSLEAIRADVVTDWSMLAGEVLWAYLPGDYQGGDEMDMKGMI
jgi:hypothetical protein